MRLERWLVLAALVLLLASLAMPAAVSESFPDQSGWDLLRQRAEFTRNGIYAWYANPALVLALVLGWFGRYQAGLVAAVIGALLALSILLAPGTLESAGRSVPEFRYGIGFYLWLAAFMSVISAGAVGLTRGRD